MTLAIVLDKKKMTTRGENAGRFHVKIRLTYTREKKTYQKYFLTNVYATPAEFTKFGGKGKKSDEISTKETAVHTLYEKGKDILKQNPCIDPEAFGDQLTARGSYKDPLSFMLAYAEELEQDGRVGTAEYYKQARASFYKFSGGVMSFGSVTPKWLLKYEKWMVEQGRSITTVGMYCIALRTIFNMARSEKRKIIPKDLYPFGKDGYVIPTAKGRKLALTEAQKNKLLSFKTLDRNLRKALDYFTFSYYCSGINFADIAALKYKHIQEDVLIFDRTKTILTQRNRDSIIVVLRDEAKEIIARQGNRSLNPDDYIFPILRDGLTPKQVADKIHDFIKETNENLDLICSKLDLPKVTTYWARHTFATIAKRKGASIEAIREALGHSSEKTTQAYLDSFDIETKKQIANML
jgi:integrase/recombinase XerD